MPGLFTIHPCDKAETMFELITGKYQEQLLFTGDGMTFSPQQTPYQGGMLFFTNQDTGSFSVVMVFRDGIACMMMNGRKFTPYLGQQPGDKK